jgi:RNA polymerase sigma factor (sigma-70 family)
VRCGPLGSQALGARGKFPLMREDAAGVVKKREASEEDALSARIEALVVEWGQLIHSAARRYGLTRADLDEVRQEVRLRLWRALERSGGREVNASYAYRAASSAAVDLVRRHRVSRHVTSDAEDVVGSATDEALLVSRLRDALSTVPESRRVAVRLHLTGRSLADVARVLHWTTAQARNQVYRGLADLKRALQDREGPLT